MSYFGVHSLLFVDNVDELRVCAVTSCFMPKADKKCYIFCHWKRKKQQKMSLYFKPSIIVSWFFL